MPPIALVTYYCLLILLASIVGGMFPVWFRLTHRWMQIAVSFVAGVMLGVGLLHMLPHAIVDALAVNDDSLAAVGSTMLWLLAGVLMMFFIERFFSYHRHDAPDDEHHDHAPDEPHDREASDAKHVHDLSWSGATLGLTLHSIINGVALAAAVEHGGHGGMLAGFGTFLVIFLHKPFDAMTIGMLMAHGGWSLAWRHAVNAFFALAIPLGVLIFYVGLLPDASEPSSAGQRSYIAYALAFSAGTFLCISLSDLLPELHFHRHDRVKLSVALLLGLAVAYAAGRVEEAVHGPHDHGGPAAPDDVTANLCHRSLIVASIEFVESAVRGGRLGNGSVRLELVAEASGPLRASAVRRRVSRDTHYAEHSSSHMAAT